MAVMGSARIGFQLTQGGGTLNAHGREQTVAEIPSPPLTHNRWKSAVRVVAYLDIFVKASLLGFWTSFVTGLMFYAQEQADKANKEDRTRTDYPLILHCALGILFMIIVAFKCFEIWTAIKLLLTTYLAREQNAVGRKTFLWRVFTLVGPAFPIMFLVLFLVTFTTLDNNLLRGFFFTAIGVTVFDFVWCVVSYSIVAKYIKSFNLTI